nr:ribonuclease H-like domain-containing protein [Tanacetum cinerariifolium]
IEQYFQVQDYAIWDVIESVNSFVLVTQTTSAEDGAITTTISSLVTAEEKIIKENNVKAKSMILMALLNEHLMTFSQYKDANKVWWLQKIISQLAVLGEFISQNKYDLDTMSIDDLYNNFKTTEQQVKRTASSSSSSQNLALMSSPSTNSTNYVYTAYGVSTTSTQSSIVSTKSLDKLIRSQTTNNSKKGLGYESYHAAPPPPTGLFSPPKNDMSYSVLEEFKQPHFESYGPKIESPIMVEKKTGVPTIPKVKVIRPKQQEKLVRKTVRPRPVNTARPINTARLRPVNTSRPNSTVVNAIRGHPQKEDQGYVDSGCSRHMTGNMYYLLEDMLPLAEEQKEEELPVKELLKLMCDKKNNVLFTDTRCFILSPDFKLTDESQVLLKVPGRNNMYSVDMKNIIPKESLTCLVAKATLDESILCLMHKKYGLVVTDNYSRYTWVFFLASKDETSGILSMFITDVTPPN